MKKKYYNYREEDFEETSYEDFEEGFDDTEIFDEFQSDFSDIDLLNDVFEGDTDLLSNFYD